MNQRATNWLIFLTFLGTVGIYVSAYMAWKKYQEYQPTIDKLSAQARQAQSFLGLLNN